MPLPPSIDHLHGLTARNFLTRPPTGTRDVPLARSRAFRYSIPLFKGVAKAAEDILIVRALRASRAPGRSLRLFCARLLVVGLLVSLGEFEEHDFLALVVDIVEYPVGADSQPILGGES